MKKKILVFPAGTEIAFEILNALKFSKFVEVIGGNSIESHADFVYSSCINGFPKISDENFVEYLNDVITKYGIDYVYPAHDSVCLKLTEEQDKIKAKVITSPLETVRICRSKAKTYEYFADENFIPETFKSPEDISDYPVFIKPSVGQGSFGAQLIESEQDLKYALSKTDEEYVICEYLSGEEQTVDCFTDKNGKLRVVLPRTRDRIRNGIAVRSETVRCDEKLRRVAERINERLKFNGAWFFQVKKNGDGEFKLLEISPRIPGTMGVSRNLGVNFPLLTLFCEWGYEVDILKNDSETVLVDRALISRYKTNIRYDAVYLDFDDTVYLGDKVNLTLVGFLYQCVNDKVKIILLTKHEKDIKQSLKKFKLSENLFDEIKVLKKQENKAEYIKEKNAIFIDDSFAERKAVKEKTGIPVFDLDMIESLLDWRV